MMSIAQRRRGHRAAATVSATRFRGLLDDNEMPNSLKLTRLQVEVHVMTDQLAKIRLADEEILNVTGSTNPDFKAATAAVEAEMTTTGAYNHNIVIAIAEAQAAIVALSSLFRQPTPEPPHGPTPVRNKRIDLSGIPTLDELTSLRYFRIWQRQWDGVHRYENIENLSIRDQRTVLNRVLSIKMQKTVDQVLGIPDDETPVTEVLDQIESHLRKKKRDSRHP